MSSQPDLVNRVIARALSDAAPTLTERGVLVTAHLLSTHEVTGETEMLEESLYVLFRGLAHRMARGATLYVRTEDRAGGDVEVAWEAREADVAREGATLTEVVRDGAHGDLLELALEGIERICRARATHRETGEPVLRRLHGPDPRPASTMRRYLILIPGEPRGSRARPVSTLPGDEAE